MAILIRRADALKRINQLEEEAREAGDHAGAEWVVRCFHAVMSCKVERKIFCNECAKRIRATNEPGELRNPK